MQYEAAPVQNVERKPVGTSSLEATVVPPAAFLWVLFLNDDGLHLPCSASEAGKGLLLSVQTEPALHSRGLSKLGRTGAFSL